MLSSLNPFGDRIRLSKLFQLCKPTNPASVCSVVSRRQGAFRFQNSLSVEWRSRVYVVSEQASLMPRYFSRVILLCPSLVSKGQVSALQIPWRQIPEDYWIPCLHFREGPSSLSVFISGCYQICLTKSRLEGLVMEDLNYPFQ